MVKEAQKIIVVGAGIAGLAAAKLLKAKGFQILILEASETVGGRIQTDKKDGFLLDRGFQVLLTAYPEAKKILNYKQLQLKPFLPGAKILYSKGISEIMDPLRKPTSLFSTLFSPIGSLGDKFQMLRLKLALKKKSIKQIFEEQEQTTDSYLLRNGFSDKMISLFFRPFLGGIFLERNLFTSSRMFNFVFKMFSEGETAIPANGMGEIPKQLANGFTNQELLFNKRVVAVEDKSVKLADGTSYQADYIVIATDQDHIPAPYQQSQHQKRKVANFYFTAQKAPFNEPIIALNANENAFVNNISVVSAVAKNYSNGNKHLISLSILEDVSEMTLETIITKIKDELSFWFDDVDQWQYLQHYFIPYALPNQYSVATELPDEALILSDSVLRCGDYLLNGSINAALLSGRRVAEYIIKK
jgi:protoporphyrinogen oxidase